MRTVSRRHILQLLAGAPLLSAHPAHAAKTVTRTATVERLIAEAKALPHVAARIDFISGRLLGARYQTNTLIGNPKQPEQFVVRDDVFDCVTFCDVVLAAAKARDLNEFEAVLRRIRYDGGIVRYDRRNHYFADWCKRNIENGICKPVAIEPSISFDKVLTWHREFPSRKVTITAVDKAVMLDNTKRLAAGDLIGFVSRRAGLDYYHTGFLTFGASGELMMRSAALSKGRALDQTMTAFIAGNPVKYVTLLRAAEDASMADRR